MEKIKNPVDVVVFAGQSNMSGRGNAAEAVVCDADMGFEYKAISHPTALVPITEPFGLGEDKAGAIDDIDRHGNTKRRGSMVSSAVSEYCHRTSRQVVAVSASIGGSSTAAWKANYIHDALERLDRTKAFLEKNNIPVSHIFIVWCQGETDGDHNISAPVYQQNTADLFRQFKEHGAEKCFLVQTGHFNYLLPACKNNANTDADTSADITETTKTDITEITKTDITENTSADITETTKTDITMNTSTDITEDTKTNITMNTSTDITEDTKTNITMNTSTDISEDTSTDITMNTGTKITAMEHDRRYGVIRNAQLELCSNHADFILAGSFEGHLKNMIDAYHYNQTAYNEVGKTVGKVMAEYVINPLLFSPENPLK